MKILEEERKITKIKRWEMDVMVRKGMGRKGMEWEGMGL